MESTPKLLDYCECEKILTEEDKKIKKNGLAIFKKLDKENTKVKMSYISLADSAYIQTFKTLFTGETKIKGINSKCRLISSLNSLLFPDASENDLKIRKIEYLPNDSVIFDNKNSKEILRFDVPCKCFCSDKELENNATSQINCDEFCVDLEMQIKYESDFVYRFNNYKDSFRSFHQLPVLILAFLNFKNGNDNNEKIKGIASFVIDDENKSLEILPEFYSNSYFINLKNEIVDLNNKKEIKLNNKKNK